MGKIKNGLWADAVGNLYRTALFLVQGKTSLAKFFLEKSAAALSKKELGDLAKLLEGFDQKLTSESREKYWAEVALDQYKKLMRIQLGEKKKSNG
jgi:hypothetical protein